MGHHQWWYQRHEGAGCLGNRRPDARSRERELDSAAGNNNRGVIIQGYVPDCDGNASGETFNGIMDGYRDFAAATNNVWFVDPREGFPNHQNIGRPCEDTENLYRADDMSHPSPLSGEVMGIAVADIIKSQSNDDENETDDQTDDENESDDENSNDDENEPPRRRPKAAKKVGKKAKASKKSKARRVLRVRKY